MLLDRFKNFIQENNLFSPDDSVLLAVSGGIDSVVMTELFRLAKFKFGMAHCNFQLRGKESDGDEHFVKDLAKKYKAKIFIKKFDTEKVADKNKLSIQEAARNLRYEWFLNIASKHK